MRSRIAIFDGYGIPARIKKRRGRGARRGARGYGFDPETLPRGYGFDPETLSRGYGFDPETLPRGYGFDPEELPKGYGFAPRTMPAGMGAPLFMNPRLQGYGRRGYLVPPIYGPARGPGGKSLKRKGYKVKKARNSKWQAHFKRAAKKCSRRRSGSFKQCMRKALKKGRGRKR